MARQPAALRKYWAKHRAKTNRPKRRRRTVARANPHRRRARRAKRNYYTSGTVVRNPRRRRRATVRRRARRNPIMKTYGRRRARRNPQFLGAVSLPPLKSIAFVGAGLVLPPIVATQIMRFLPIEWQGSKPAFYAVKAASVILPSILARKMVSREAGTLMLLGGAASFLIDILKETGIMTQLGLGDYAVSRVPVLPYRSLNRGLGEYNLRPAVAQAPSNNYDNVPRRLTPR